LYGTLEAAAGIFQNETNNKIAIKTLQYETYIAGCRLVETGARVGYLTYVTSNQVHLHNTYKN